MYHDPHTISVWFVCKPCRRSFLQIEDFFRHKNERHFEEFQNYKCIVFEEKVVFHEVEPNESNEAELGLQESLPPSPTHSLSIVKQETENKRINTNTYDDHTPIFEEQNDIPPAVVVDLRLVKQESIPPTAQSENKDENDDNETDLPDFYGTIQAPQHSYCFVSDSDEIPERSSSFPNDVVTEIKRENFDYFSSNNSNHNTHYDDNYYVTDERPRPRNSVIINSSNQNYNSHHIFTTAADRSPTLQRPNNEINNFWSDQASIIRNSGGAITDKCKLCSKKFLPGPDLSTHLALCIHTSKNRKSYCLPCNKLFCNVQTLQNHNRSFHTSDEERAERYKFACTLCPKKFIQEASLLSHTNSHRNKSQEPKLRPFICFHCNLTFALSAQLSVHLRTHLDERPFECLAPNCGKAFKFKRNLDDHMIVHSNCRPFACPFDGCGKTFKVKMNCTIHLRTHTGERPYKCLANNCGKSYLTASNLNHHVTKMHRKF